MPNSVKSIENYTFYGCTALKEIIIPDSVTSIGWEAFYGCSALKEVMIPDSVTSIGEKAFWGCSTLKVVTIPDSVTSIGDDAFWGCGLEKIVIPLHTREKFVKLLPNDQHLLVEVDVSTWVAYKHLKNAWKDEQGVLYSQDGKRLLKCSERGVISYTVLGGTEIICNLAFSNSLWLEEITIPDSVTHIGDWAFDGYFFGKIIIPRNSRKKFEELLPDYKDRLVEL